MTDEYNSDAASAAPAFTVLADLASARVGARAVAANDDFFAPKSNLIKPDAPVFIPGKYTSRGKWMDGWESRRRRTPGHDWCIVALGMRGIVRGVNVDTSFFTGNFPTHCSIDAADVAGARAPRMVADERNWWPLLVKSPLHGNSHNFFAVGGDRPLTHVRLNIFPDGGVARLRVYGDVVVDWRRHVGSRRSVDLAALQNGGLAIAASDMHYGTPNNMLLPGRAPNMGEGWETKRRRGPGHDWAIIRLGAPGVVTKVEVDTNHYKGNYPDSASLDALPAGASTWTELLPQTKLRAHHRHYFVKELRAVSPVSQVRLNIFPDGGVSRLRVYGRVAGA